jgi:DivIVA domain-containing protein
MPLTPEDVSNKRFTPVRLREGYDMGEVDQFLDEVESELSRLTRENDELRAKLGAAQDGDGTAPAGAPASTSGAGLDSSAPTSTGSTTAQPAVSDRAASDGAASEGAATAETPVETPVETLKVTTVADASSAAVRLLEIATRNASELVGEAQTEAGRIIGDARTTAQQLEAQSKERADRLEAESRSRSQKLDAETAERRERLFGDLETERERLNGEVDNLRTFEREYRARLKTYFEQQLAALDGAAEPASLEGGSTGSRSRLKSLLGDDQQA